MSRHGDDRLRAFERAALAGDLDALVSLVMRERMPTIDGEGDTDGDPWAVTLRKRPGNKADRKAGCRLAWRQSSPNTREACRREFLLVAAPWHRTAFALMAMTPFDAEPIMGRQGYNLALTFQDRDELAEFLRTHAIDWVRHSRLIEVMDAAYLERGRASQARRAEATAATEERDELRRQKRAVRSLQAKLERARAARKRATGKRLAAANALRHFDAQAEGRPLFASGLAKRRALAETLATAEAVLVAQAERLLELADEVAALPG